MYKYEAVIERVIDDYTVDALVDLGFNIHIRIRVCLYGIAPTETRTRNNDEKIRGIEAKERLIQLLERTENQVTLVSQGIDKHGRCLGTLFTNEISCNQQLLIENLAVPHFP